MDSWNVNHMVAVSSTVTLPMVEGMVFSSWLMWWASSCQSAGGHQSMHVFLYTGAVVRISEGSLSAGMGFWHFKPDRTLDRTGWSIHAEEETHVLCSLAFTAKAHQNLAVQFRLISVFGSQWSDMYWRNGFLCTWLGELLWVSRDIRLMHLSMSNCGFNGSCNCDHTGHIWIYSSR